MSDKKEEIEMFVAGLVLDPNSNAPIVILKEPDRDIGLPIWIGLPEATAIASALKKVGLARPMTHDLLKSVMDELGGRLVRVSIHALVENTFHAHIEVVAGETLRILDCRPSDAIALAVRVGAPIFVTRDVLEAAKVTMVPIPPDSVEEGGEAGPESAEADWGDSNFANIDKDQWAEILEQMDPDDFKYKM